MHELKPLLITYSRSKANPVDGLRKSLAEGERRILQDITNSSNKPVEIAGRKSIVLDSPCAVPPSKRLPSKINVPDGSLHSGFVSCPTDPEESINVFEDNEGAESSLKRAPLQHLSIKNVPELSDDFWSPRRIANATGVPPARKMTKHSMRAATSVAVHEIQIPIDPRHLEGKIWVRSNPTPLAHSNLPDHFSL